jgi:hypothetical protein
MQFTPHPVACRAVQIRNLLGHGCGHEGASLVTVGMSAVYEHPNIIISDIT